MCSDQSIHGCIHTIHTLNLYKIIGYILAVYFLLTYDADQVLLCGEVRHRRI